MGRYVTCCNLANGMPWTFVGPEFGPGSGVCQVYSAVTGSAPVGDGGTISSSPDISPRVWTSYPSSSPWVTATGSTRLRDVGAHAQDVRGGEVASVAFGSGGGLSFDFPLPSWQKDAVRTYFNRSAPFRAHLPPAGSYPGAAAGFGRGNPDISAAGENFAISQGYTLMNVSGTSGVAPFFAGIVTRLNVARTKPMGFLNPWLYANPQMFNDVTHGTNAVARDGSLLPYGFNASAGWDPATGLGTPRYPEMLAAALAALAA